MTKFSIRGQQVAAEQAPADLREFDGLISEIEPIAYFELNKTRDSGEDIELDFPEDAVVEITIDDGSVIYIRSDELGADIVARRGPTRESGAIAIDGSYWGGGSDTRGIRDWAINHLRFFKVNPLTSWIDPAAKSSAHLTAQAVSAKIEGTLQNSNRISRVVVSNGALSLTRVTRAEIPIDRPVLLFLHGTASTTDGSFGELWRGKHGVMDALVRHYRSSIFAFEHDTLSRSPIENAATLVEQLPDGVTVHIVSHSRGGQIGELLCRANRVDHRSNKPLPPFDDKDKDLFSAEQELHSLALDGSFRAEQLAHLECLSSVLTSKQISVQRFVRVACPVGGTSLLSQRLDRWLNMLLNAAGYSGLNNSPAYSFLKTFLVTLVAERRDAQDFPGLEGMTPESALARVLNRPDVTVASDLTVISGDLKTVGIGSFLKTLSTDWLYGGDHDLVVNTVSMRGGAQRAGNACREFFESGGEVTHFNYFAIPSFANRVGKALIKPIESLEEFSPLEPGIPERIRGIQSPPVMGNRPKLFVLPGIMGSNLAFKGDRIWVDYWDLFRGGMRKLGVENNNYIQPDGAHEKSYAAVIEYMSRSHDVHLFPYDWRLPILDAAEKLTNAVQQQLDGSEQPVRFLAHSMGGLVVRCMQSINRNGIWDRVSSRPGSRLVMLGTPNGGSHSIVRVLIGFKKTLKLLAGIDVKTSKKQMLKIVSRFQGMLQLLPIRDRHGNDYFGPEVWNKLDQITRLTWAKPSDVDIASIRPYRQILEAATVHPDQTIYVAGKADSTVISMKLQDPTSRRPLRFFATEEGDGSVPWSTGSLNGSPDWYTLAEHGFLAAHREAFEGYKQLLETGTTTSFALLKDPPTTARRNGELFEVEEDALERAPGISDLDRVIFDLHPPQKAVETERKIQVGVVHADLAFANAPIVVGHYLDDVIVSAEGVIDRRLNGRLSTLMAIGDYPEAIGQAEVLLTNDTFPGAIVVGLGRFGELRAGSLSVAYRTAVLRLVRTQATNCTHKHARSPNLATLLIGSAQGGVSIEDSLAAAIQGIQQANALLARSGSTQSIDRFEVIELWEDRALEAAYALQRIAEGSAQGDIVNLGLCTRKGGRQRIRFGDSSSWWQRIQVMVDQDQRLCFRAITDRARIDVQHLHGRLEAIEDYITSAATFRHAKDQQIGKTLFEYLVPQAYKPFGLNAENVILGVDSKTARIPWELLIDREAQKVAESLGRLAEPLSVASGMIRQLIIDQQEDTRDAATESTALIISDPANTELPRLQGAAEEGELVHQLLMNSGFIPERTRHISQAGKAEILEALVADDYRILHLAGHGNVVKDERGESAGLVIDGGALLSGTTLEGMRKVPELAFINCCHLGQLVETDEDSIDYYRKVAASLSRTLISMGAKAVVAAGWAVSDAKGKEFARVFYREMIDGANFGRAVQLARRAIFLGHGDNTWGAYQCYGHPDFTFSKAGQNPPSQAHRKSFVSVNEAVSFCRRIAADAGDLVDSDEDSIRSSLSLVVPRLHTSWYEEGALPTALGRAYGELGDYETAIRYYEIALKSERGSPIYVIEQLANMEVRRAVEIYNKDSARAEELMAAGLGRLEGLLTCTSQTAERLAILGSAYRRRSLIGKDQIRRLSDLDAAAIHYSNSAHLARNKPGEDYGYPQTQNLVCAIARQRSSADRVRKSAVDDAVAIVDQLLAEQSTRPDDFWALVRPADLMLTRAVWTGTLTSDITAIKTAYTRAIGGSSSIREQSSVRETLEFLIFHFTCWSNKKPNSQAAEFVIALEEIKNSVVSEM